MGIGDERARADHGVGEVAHDAPAPGCWVMMEQVKPRLEDHHGADQARELALHVGERAGIRGPI